MGRTRRNTPGHERRPGAIALAIFAGVIVNSGVAPAQDQGPSEPSALTADALAVPDLERLLGAGDAAGLAAAISSTPDWAWIESASLALLDPRHAELCTESAVIKAYASRLGDAPAPQRGAMLGVLSRSNDREAVRAAIGLLEMELAPETARRLFQCLVEQTGRSDLGEDADAWRRWWSEHEWIPEAEWLRRVARWQSERSRRLLERTRASERGRADLYREIYSLTPAESRPAMLIRLLGDPAVDARRLGLELASRAVVNATPLPPEVIGAATTLLRDASPEVRAGAATLLASAGINGAAADISQALSRERRPLPARAMLEAMSFTTPSRADLENASTWLDDDQVAPAAARLMAVGAERGGLTSARLRNLAWSAVQEDCGVSLGPAGVQLFGLLAPSSRFGELAALLDSNDGAVRDAAAEALSARAAGVEALSVGAQKNPSFLRFLLDALTLWTPTQDAWTRVCAIRDITDVQLGRVAGALPHAEALAAARAETNLSRKLLLLERFSPERLEAVRITPGVLRDARVLRLGTLLDLGRFEQVIREGDAMSQADATEDAGVQPRSVRVALLCLERIDEAMAAGATAEDWIEAVERLADGNPEGARRLAQSLQDQPSLGLTSIQASHLDSITRQLPEFEPAAIEPPGSDEEGPKTPSRD